MKIIFGLLILFFLTFCSPPETTDFYGNTMGTTYSIKIAGADISAEQKVMLQKDIDTLLKDVNMRMSTYIPESEISVFNRSQSTSKMVVSEQFMEVTRLSKQISAESGGAFDVTVGPAVDLWGFGKKDRRENPPSLEEVAQVKEYVGMDKLQINENSISKTNPKTELDFSAVAKGYGVDKVAELIKNRGYENYLVEIGGEVVVKGKNANNEKWRVGIDKPLIEQTVNRNLQAILAITNVAVATSGDYRNYFVSHDSLYSHTLDPKTCRPIINGVASATIVAPNCAMADAMATAIMVMGEEKAIAWIESKPDVEAMVILREEDGFKIIQSSGFSAYLAE